MRGLCVLFEPAEIGGFGGGWSFLRIPVEQVFDKIFCVIRYRFPERLLKLHLEFVVKYRQFTTQEQIGKNTDGPTVSLGAVHVCVQFENFRCSKWHLRAINFATVLCETG